MINIVFMFPIRIILNNFEKQFVNYFNIRSFYTAVAPWLCCVASRRARCHAREEQEQEQDSVRRGPRPCIAPATLRCTRARLLSGRDLGCISLPLFLSSSRPLVLSSFCTPRTKGVHARRAAVPSPRLIARSRQSRPN